jgi:GSH-dependent disulfide-bond oxidoreductase
MIELLTAGTPNGHKISIMLEELAVDYRYRKIDLSSNEQKQESFLRLNPNGKIPVIIDHNPSFQEEPWVVFESGAILWYLAEKHNKFLPSEPSHKNLALQWLMFQVGGVGPMMGQSNVFRHYAPQTIEYAINRYAKETRRLLEVVNRGLLKSDFLAGDYSIADIALFSWIRGYEWSGASIDGLDHLDRWLDRIESRPAVQKGVHIPSESLGGDLKNDAAMTIEIAKNLLV